MTEKKLNLSTFKLAAETDGPLLLRLQKESPGQLDVLIAVQTEPKLTPYAVVSEELGINLNTVKSRLHRARVKMIQWRAEAAAIEDRNGDQTKTA